MASFNRENQIGSTWTTIGVTDCHGRKLLFHGDTWRPSQEELQANRYDIMAGPLTFRGCRVSYWTEKVDKRVVDFDMHYLAEVPAQSHDADPLTIYLQPGNRIRLAEPEDAERHEEDRGQKRCRQRQPHGE